MRSLFYIVLSAGLIVVLMAVSVVLIFRTNDLSEITLNYENMLKSSFQEAFNDMRIIENDLSKLMVTVNKKTATNLMAKVQLKSMACSQELSKLPIVATGVQNTLKFVNQLSSYCATALNKYSVENAFPENFDKQIEEFFSTCKNVNVELSYLESDVLNNKISVLDINQGNVDVEGIMGSIDNDVLEYPSVIFDGPFSDGQERSTPKSEREQVTTEKAKEYAKNLGFDIPFKKEINGILPVYLFENENVSIQITKKGGLLLSAISDRVVGEPVLDEKEAEEKALRFAEKLNYGQVKNVWQEFYANSVVFNFAPIVDNVIIYPDIFKVKVALDNGDIIAFEGKSYVMNNHPRQIESKVISIEDAKKQLKEGFEIETSRLAVISVNEKEHLCYEFYGKYNDLTFAIYISAIDGQEKTSFRILSTETGRMAA